MIRAFLLLCARVALASCKQSPGRLALSFGAYAASPVVLTGFSIGEGTPTDIMAKTVDSDADIHAQQGYGRTGNLALIGVGELSDTFIVNAAWEEIMTGRVYAGKIEVALEDMTIDDRRTMRLQVNMGPHGFLLIASDDFSNPPVIRREAGWTCTDRTPDLDRIWWRRTGYLPEIDELVERERPPVTDTDCPEPET